MTNTFKKWGYKPDDSQLFEVTKDDPELPNGWHESPADIDEDEKKNHGFLSFDSKGKGNLSTLSKNELMKMAENEKINISYSWNKADIIKALEKAKAQTGAKP